MTKEALKLALEALEKVKNDADKQPPVYPWDTWRLWVDDAINVLRLVIDAENISSKSVAWEQFYPEMGSPKLAHLSPTESSENACYTPPQRTWVGLTEREQGAIMEDLNAYGTNLYQFAHAIEAKLKEKNT